MSVTAGRISGMSTAPAGRIPQLTLGWRLKLSLGEMSRDRIAEIMDVTPSTISRWMKDKGAPPRRPYLIQWAVATGVDLHWLETGQGSPGTPPGGGEPIKNAALAQLAARKRARHAGDGANHRYGDVAA